MKWEQVRRGQVNREENDREEARKEKADRVLRPQGQEAGEQPAPVGGMRFGSPPSTLVRQPRRVVASILFPEYRFVAISGIIVVIYLISIFVLATRPIGERSQLNGA